MSQIFEDGLFHTVLEMVTNIVNSIECGIKYEESYIEVAAPDGELLKIPRGQWKRETQVALEFFESYERYEQCAQCVSIMETLEQEPTIQDLVHQLSKHAEESN